MPTKRKVTGSRAAGAPHQQATLSFNGKQTKVTKLGAAQHAKTFKKDPLESDDVVELDSTAEDLAKPSGSSTPIASTVDQVNDEDAPAAAEIAQPIDDATKVEDVLGGRAVQSKVGAVGGKGSGWVADEEQQARKITEPQIARYWRAKEQERLAPRVHQEDLTLHEKLLREWDMTSQYGVSNHSGRASVGFVLTRLSHASALHD